MVDIISASPLDLLKNEKLLTLFQQTDRQAIQSCLDVDIESYSRATELTSIPS
jgi:hypothetical protein